MDIIEQSLEDAKKELDKNRGHEFNDKYKVSKLVGHGAFAKVTGPCLFLGITSVSMGAIYHRVAYHDL